MIAAKKVPTSKLVYASVFPGKIEVKTRIGVEEEVFLRLTKEFKLTPDKARQFIEGEQDVISSRGEDISKYYFCGKHDVDDVLRAYYGAFDTISRVVSYRDNLDGFTFSELVLFFNVFGNKYNFYNYRQLQLEKKLKAEDKRMSKLLSGHASFAEKEEAFNNVKELKASLEEQKRLEGELVGLFQMLRNCSMSKMATQLDTTRNDIMFALRLIPEGGRVNSINNIDINFGEMAAEHKDLTQDVYSHDVDILSDFNVKGYSFIKRK